MPKLQNWKNQTVDNYWQEGAGGQKIEKEEIIHASMVGDLNPEVKVLLGKNLMDVAARWF